MSRWGPMSDEKPEPPKKKRKSRWAAPDDQAFIPGMPTVMPSGLSEAQEKQYIIQLQIEEVSRKLRSGDLGIPARPEDRSPSPEPIYNNEGKRMNTREYRTKKRLEEERHSLVMQMQDINPDFKPPADYKAPLVRVTDKVFIPQDDHPNINFIGLLIGPRGNTLRQLEKETGAKIVIRGKGSVKEGKIGRKDGQPMPGEDEPLHAYITAQTTECAAKAVKKINEIIKEGIEVPDGQSELRRQQMRDLALYNGTLRENDGLAKLKQLAEAQEIVTNTIVCTFCGGAGHIAQDCKAKKPNEAIPGAVSQQSAAPTHLDKARMDSEYMSLMAELGEAPPELPKTTPAAAPAAPFAQRVPPRPSFNQPPPSMMPLNASPAPGYPPQNRPPWQQEPPKPVPGFNAPPPWMQQPYRPPHPGFAPPTNNPNMYSSPPAGSQPQPTGRAAPWLNSAPPPPPPASQPPWMQSSNGGSNSALAPPPPPPAAMRPLMSAPPPPPQ